MKKCKQCKKEFTPLRPLQFVCSFKCSIDYSYDQRKKKEAKEKKDWAKKKREFKEKNKTYTQRVNEVKKVAQEYCRKRDKDLPCISCGTMTSDIWDGGHFKKAELYSGVILNEFNINRQCRKCNHFLGGNELNYREGLIKKIGEDAVLELENQAKETRLYKYTLEQLEETKAYFKQKLKEL